MPEGLIVGDLLNCSYNKLEALPENLVVGGFLDCSYNKLKALPENLVVGKRLLWSDNESVGLKSYCFREGEMFGERWVFCDGKLRYIESIKPVPQYGYMYQR